MKILLIIILACTIVSCHSGTEKKVDQQRVKSEKHNAVPTKTRTNPLQHAVMEFVEYNDNGDYFMLTAKKRNEVFSFVNDNIKDRSLLRGDLIEITWKTTSIEIAGDGGTRIDADEIVSIKKVKDGNVSKFRKHYQKPIKYTWPQEESYSKHFLDKLYSLVEYYVANSNNELIQLHIKNNDQLSYSIERQTRDDKAYVMVGISITSAHQVHTIQWLYLDQTTDILYAYDLPNDKLVKFN
jgi:hypothetical protein